MQKIIPNLWFDKNAEEAVNFYASIFKDVKIGTIARYDKASAEVSGQPEGSVLTVDFEIFGQQFVAINGGPLFKFTEAVSFAVMCDAQEEIDHYWSSLTANGGAESQCGWLKDKFGLSWQIVPKMLVDLMAKGEPQKVQGMMKAMLQMKKLIIADLEKGYQDG